MRLAIVLAILALSLAGYAADNAAFLFPEKPAQENMNLEYGEKALSERLYKNAIRYLTLFSEEAKGRPEKAKAATLLSQAYLLDGQPRKALDAVNGFLAKDPLADDLPTRARLFLTAGEACNALGEHATALNFLQPLMKELETAPHEREAQTLCAIAEPVMSESPTTACRRSSGGVYPGRFRSSMRVRPRFHLRPGRIGDGGA